MHHVNTEILKENQNLRNELKELTSITEAWLNSSNKVNQCISEQISTQKKKILGVDQLTEDTSSSGPKDPVFVKSSADNSKVSITDSNKPKLSKAEDSTLLNHDTGKHPLPPLEKLTGVEPVSGPKTIKSILKSKSTFKAETLKVITINEPSSAPSRGNKSSSASKTNSAPADPDLQGQQYLFPLAYIVDIMIINLMIVYTIPYVKYVEAMIINVHTTSDHNDIEWFRKIEALQAKKVESFKASKTESSSALRSKTPTKKYLKEKALQMLVSFLKASLFAEVRISSNLYKEATKAGSSKAPTSSKISHSKKRKEFSLAMDSNPSQPLVSTPVDTRMHKEDQQATGGPTSLGAPVKKDPSLSSIVSALGNDASAVSTAEADPRKSAPSNFVPQQQGMNEGTKNTSYDQLFVGTDPHVLAEQTKSVSEGLDTVLTQPLTGKGASSIARQVEEEEASRTIKLEDLAKLVSNVQPSFKDLDSPEDDPVIIVESNAEEDDGIHATENSQKHKLELEINKAEAEAALLKAQPSFPNVEQLNELLVKSLKTEFSNILSAHDFSNSLPTELKNLPSKFKKLTEEDFTKTVTSLTSQVAELKTLQ
ncbi:hypothetical protein Tco_0367475 [Tanacetum coccineum]